MLKACLEIGFKHAYYQAMKATSSNKNGNKK